MAPTCGVLLVLEVEIPEGVFDFEPERGRLQPEKPPTIADRAQYLKQELAKPETERVLKMPEQDQQQRPYKL